MQLTPNANNSQHTFRNAYGEEAESIAMNEEGDEGDEGDDDASITVSEQSDEDTPMRFGREPRKETAGKLGQQTEDL